MNPDLLKKALNKVGNPNVLVNLVSRRVRQLNDHKVYATSRALVSGTDNLGMADIALREIIEEKIGWEIPDVGTFDYLVARRNNVHWGMLSNLRSQ